MELGGAESRAELCCFHIPQWQLGGSQGLSLTASMRVAFHLPPIEDCDLGG